MFVGSESSIENRPARIKFLAQRQCAMSRCYQVDAIRELHVPLCRPQLTMQSRTLLAGIFSPSKCREVAPLISTSEHSTKCISMNGLNSLWLNELYAVAFHLTRIHRCVQVCSGQIMQALNPFGNVKGTAIEISRSVTHYQ